MQGLWALFPRESFANHEPGLPSWLCWWGRGAGPCSPAVPRTDVHTAGPSTDVQRRLMCEGMNGAVTLGASE